MKNRFCFIIVLFVGLLIAFKSHCLACSTFMLKKGDSFIVGFNDDEYLDYFPGYIFINKRGMTKTSFSIKNLFGESDNSPKIQWTSKYGSVTFNPMGREFPFRGINEAGLFISNMYLDETDYSDTNTNPHLLGHQWVQYLLDNYQSVDELIRNLPQLVPEFCKWHFFVSDKKGHYACISYINGEPKIFTCESMPIPVLCNTYYKLEMLSIQEYQGFGGARNLYTASGDTRFIHAATMIKNYHPEQSKPGVEYGLEILKQLERGNNKWSVVIDLNQSKVYFHTSLNRKVKYFNYTDFDFSINSPVKMFDLNSDLEGDVTKHFLPYTFKLNKKFAAEYFIILNEINNWGLTKIALDEVVKRVANFPETTKPSNSQKDLAPHVFRYSGVIFNASNQRQVLVGNHETGIDKDAKVWFLPAEKGELGRVFFGFQNADPVGGMNDQGLFYDKVVFYQGKPAPLSTEKTTYQGNIYEKILEECSNVDQAIGIIRKYHIPELGFNQVMFADRSGASVIVTWDEQKNELEFIRKNPNHQILGDRDIPAPKFIIDSENTSISHFRSMLEATHHETATVYSNIYDLKKGEIYLYYLNDYRNPVKINLAAELSKGKHIYDLYALFPQKKYTGLDSLLDKYYSPTNKGVIILLLIILLSPFIVWPVIYVIKRSKVNEEPEMHSKRQSLIARIIASLSSILCFVLLYFVIKYPLLIPKYGLNVCGSIIGLIPVAVMILTGAEIFSIIMLWKGKNWSLLERSHYLLLILINISSIYLLSNLNSVVGW
jgi:penicillin V acylase-like amidase (Ntn superfamily)